MHVGNAKLRRRWCSSIKLESGRRYHHLPYNFLIKTAKLMRRSFYSPAFRICIGKKFKYFERESSNLAPSAEAPHYTPRNGSAACTGQRFAWSHVQFAVLSKETAIESI